MVSVSSLGITYCKLPVESALQFMQITSHSYDFSTLEGELSLEYCIEIDLPF